MERLLYDFPGEIEAKAQLVLSLWSGRSNGLPISSYLAVDALIGEILAGEPMHPVHHYRIHLWDHEKSEKAIPSAALSGQSAPGIAHMWHMGGHIFSGLERYTDAVWQQEASSRVDHAYMMQDWILPDQIHNYAHNQEWMIRNLRHVGRAHDAVRLAQNLIAHPRHPKHNTGQDHASSQQGKARLFETLEQFELWPQLAMNAQSPYLDPPASRLDRAEQARWLAIAAYRQNDFATGDLWQTKISEELAACTRETDALRPIQETNPEFPVTAILPENGPNVGQQKDLESQKTKLDKWLHELKGTRAFQQPDFASAFAELKQGEPDKVDPFLLARVQWLAGEKDDALKKARDALGSRKNQVRALALAGELFWLAGLKDEAKTELEKLRTLSSDVDLDTPVFARLAPIAQELGWPTDWRIKSPPPPDTGVRPPLESLGPLTWSPPVSPTWTALDDGRQSHASAEFDGKPKIIMFYLGSGCLHCAQQLTAFADRAGEFEAQGVGLLAIGTDDPENLSLAIKNYEPKVFPFALYSDAGFQTFKAFRCFDDFENQPLHGTFLIDAQGRLRWWDISHEPFMNVEFLLKESSRLLKLPEG
jgi:peroxiredoxin